MTPRTRRLALFACVLAATALRVGRLLERPFIHTDGPGYIATAQHLGANGWTGALAGYFPPGYPAAMRAAHAAGLDWEAAGLAVSVVAGVAVVPLVARLGTVVLGPEVGLAAAALAAVHPKLVLASTRVLAEMTYGLLLVVWALLLLGGGGRFVLAGAVAGAAMLVRVEGVVLVPLAALAAAWRAEAGERLRRMALVLGTAAVFVVPVVVSMRVEHGIWGVSGKEIGTMAAKYGVPASGVLDLVLRFPGTFVAVYARFLAQQIEFTITAMHVLLVAPVVLGLAAPLDGAGARRGRGLTLAAVAAFTLAIALVSPNRRYVTPFVPLLLPWAALGAFRLVAFARAGRFGRAGLGIARHAALAAGLVLVALGAEGLAKEGHRETARCYREVCTVVHERFGARPPAIMAHDSRIAYLCGARYVRLGYRERGRAREVALRRGARLWVVRKRWLADGLTEGFMPLAERCRGGEHLVVLEIG